MGSEPAASFSSGVIEAIHAIDSTGRKLTLKQLGAVDRLRIFKAIGGALAANPPYLGLAMLAFSVTEIDGVPVPPPCNEAQLEGLVQRLGDCGLDAVADALDAQDKAAPECDAGN